MFFSLIDLKILLRLISKTPRELKLKSFLLVLFLLIYSKILLIYRWRWSPNLIEFINGWKIKPLFPVYKQVLSGFPEVRK